MKKLILIFYSLICVCLYAQTTVFSDNFSSDQSATYTTSAGNIGTSTWSLALSGTDWGARRNTSPAQLELTNDASVSANENGWAFAYVFTSSFSAPFNSTLNSNPGLVSWYFNMRQIRTDPAGFGAVTNYGVAFVLLGSNTSTNTAGNGYVVTLGESGSNDYVRLQKYNNGLQGTLTSLITGNTDFGTDYLSIKVTYNPTNDQWELFVRNDCSSFSDPTSGSLTSQGTATDNTYTSTSLSYLGAYWQGSIAANQTAFFDNVSVTVVINPVTNVTLTGTGSGTGRISWNAPSNYSNTNNEIIVFLKRSSSITEGTPSTAIGNYTANSAFGVGTAYENDPAAFCMYKGDGTSVDVTNILDGSTYTALIFNTNNASSYSTSATNTAALPVELTSFTSNVHGNKVDLNWQTATEVNNYGFEIERRQTSNVKSETWEMIGFIKGSGNSNSPKNYSYTDEPLGGKVFKYRLKQIDFNGAFEYSKEVTAVLQNIASYKLEQNYPNPFNPVTKISYTIPEKAFVRLRVYDMLARQICELVNSDQEAGRYEALFDAANLPSGSYFYKLEAGKYVEVKKLLLVK